MIKTLTILLSIIILSACVESNNEDIIEKQDDFSAVNDTTYNNVSPDTSLPLEITEIPEFQLISSIEITNYDDEFNKSSSNCGGKEYWHIIKMGESALPFLISKLKSSVKTTITIPCDGSFLTEGGLALILIDKIIGIPFYTVFQMQFDVFELNCNFRYPSGLLDYMIGNPERTHNKISEWYVNNRMRIIEVDLVESNMSDCQKEFGIKTKLVIGE